MTSPRVMGAEEAAQAMDEPDIENEVTPEDMKGAAVGPQSPLGILRGKRADLEATLFFDLQVPRWDEVIGRAIWVRYAPGKIPTLNTASERRKESHEKSVKAGKFGDPEWLIKANADMLVESCMAVYDLAIGEEPPLTPLPTNLPTFGDYALSEALDTPERPCPRNAVGTCLHLYGTGADILVASQQLLVWSGEVSKEADRSFLPQ